jgi:CBS domain containing-hemolysin-like protein
LVFDALGHVPTEGECARVNGFVFCAERVQGRRIVSVRVTPAPDRSSEPEE